MNTAVNSGAILLAGLLLLAAAHKVNLLRRGEAHAEPLIRISSWRNRHARSVLLGALIIESVTAALLVTQTPLGLAGLALLTLAYAFAMRRLPPRESCRCFGSLSRAQSRAPAIRRNLILATFSVFALIAHWGGWANQEGVSQASLGVALLTAGFLAALSALHVIAAQVQTSEAQTKEVREGVAQ